MWQFVGLKCSICGTSPTNRKHLNIRATLIEGLLLFPGPKQATYKINIKSFIPLFNDTINCWDYTATVVNEWIGMEQSEMILIAKDRGTRWRKPVVVEHCPPQILHALAWYLTLTSTLTRRLTVRATTRTETLEQATQSMLTYHSIANKRAL